MIFWPNMVSSPGESNEQKIEHHHGDGYGLACGYGINDFSQNQRREQRGGNGARNDQQNAHGQE